MQSCFLRRLALRKCRGITESWLKALMILGGCGNHLSKKLELWLWNQAETGEQMERGETWEGLSSLRIEPRSVWLSWTWKLRKKVTYRTMSLSKATHQFKCNLMQWSLENQPIGRLPETPRCLFCILLPLSRDAQNLWNLPESSRSYMAHVLIISFLSVLFKSNLTLSSGLPCPSQTYSGLDWWYVIISRANIYRVPSISHLLYLFGPHKKSMKHIILSCPFFR